MAAVAAGEDIGKALADALEHGSIGISWDRRHDQIVDGAEIVDAVDMVSVGVGVEQCVDLADAGVQALPAQVRAGIDQDALTPCLDEDGTAAATVARVGRAADGAVAADLRHARGGAAAQHRYAHAAALANSRWKLAVVARSISAMGRPRTSASVRATWAV